MIARLWRKSADIDSAATPANAGVHAAAIQMEQTSTSGTTDQLEQIKSQVSKLLRDIHLATDNRVTFHAYPTYDGLDLIMSRDTENVRKQEYPMTISLRFSTLGACTIGHLKIQGQADHVMDARPVILDKHYELTSNPDFYALIREHILAQLTEAELDGYNRTIWPERYTRQEPDQAPAAFTSTPAPIPPK